MASRPDGAILAAMVSEALPSELPPELAGGRFRCIAVLGRGSQGLTFMAEDRERGVRVAIKRFQIQGAPSWKQVELAEREALVLATLQHPNLPAYITHFEEAGALYLVMELVEGKTLGELKREGALSQRDVIELLRSTAKTLDYLHGRAPPIVHRDVKPQNVIRRPDGSFVLVDFGSVRDKLRPEGGSTVVGTFGYMAPEQFQGRALPVTDTYGLGATAIACLSGAEPEHLPHKGLAIDVRGALAGRADPRLIGLLERMLEPDPERRPRDLSGALAVLSKPSAKPVPDGEAPHTISATRRELRRALRDLKSVALDPHDQEARERLKGLLEKSGKWGELAKTLTREAEQTVYAEARIAVEKALDKSRGRRERRERRQKLREQRERARRARWDGSLAERSRWGFALGIVLLLISGFFAVVAERHLIPIWLMVAIFLVREAKRRRALAEISDEAKQRFRVEKESELEEGGSPENLADELDDVSDREHEPRTRR